MSRWTDHVKAYSQQHGVTYGEAMSLARSSYRPQSGGKINLKKVVRKARNAVNRGSNVVKKGARQGANVLDKHGDLISRFDSELGQNLADVSNNLRQVENYASHTANATGGKMKFKNVVRKARNTTRRVTRGMDKIAPLVTVVNPELGMTLMGANQAVKTVNGSGRGGMCCKHCGATLGGSFRTIGGSFKTIGSGVQLGRAESSILASTHNSFAPMKPKSYSRRVKEN